MRDSVFGNQVTPLMIPRYVADIWELYGMRRWLPASWTACLVRCGPGMASAASSVLSTGVTGLLPGESLATPESLEPLAGSESPPCRDVVCATDCLGASAPLQVTADVIDAQSRYGGAEPETLEGRNLQYSDAVEYAGAVGYARAIARELESGTYGGNLDESPALIERLIERAEGTMHTERGRALIRDRVALLRAFRERLRAESEGQA